MKYSATFILLCGAILPLGFVSCQRFIYEGCEINGITSARCTDLAFTNNDLKTLQMPSKLLLLNFDRNKISHLVKNYFWSTRELIGLSIAQNELLKIDKDAFEGLTRLKNLNLSYNYNLEIDTRIFKDLPLEVLDLSGVYLYNPSHKLAIKSDLLKELYLKGCEINYITGLFNDLPNLEKLDISKNALTSLDIGSLLWKVNFLNSYVNVEGNELICNQDTELVITHLRRYTMTYKGPICRNVWGEHYRDKISLADNDELEKWKMESKKLVTESSKSFDKNMQRLAESELTDTILEKRYHIQCPDKKDDFVCHMLQNCRESPNCGKYLEGKIRSQNIFHIFLAFVILIFGSLIGYLRAFQLDQKCNHCSVQQNDHNSDQNGTQRVNDDDNDEPGIVGQLSETLSGTRDSSAPLFPTSSHHQDYISFEPMIINNISDRPTEERAEPDSPPPAYDSCVP